MIGTSTGHFYCQTYITIQYRSPYPVINKTHKHTNTWGSTLNVSLSMHAKDAKAATVM